MAQDGGDIQVVVVLMRHGMRADRERDRSGVYNAQAWPNWPTKAGVLTPHGGEALRLLAEFYRVRLSLASAKRLLLG
jgi:4-phytase/acid phosphatase